MNANCFLRLLTGRMLLLGTTLAIVLLVGEQSVMAHGDGISEANPSHASESSSPSPSSPKAAGLQAACWALSMPYGAAKIAYAIGGGVVGGLAWTVTGGNMELAKSIWVPSMTGDYIIQPQHLTRDKHLYFVGPPEEPPL
ncbi:MAG TPA: hypothetical protein PKD12_22400 [Nitrospira sp.]|nr:hypothetical protein [Nitrospira sp.]